MIRPAVADMQSYVVDHGAHKELGGESECKHTLQRTHGAYLYLM